MSKCFLLISTLPSLRPSVANVIDMCQWVNAETVALLLKEYSNFSLERILKVYVYMLIDIACWDYAMALVPISCIGRYHKSYSLLSTDLLDTVSRADALPPLSNSRSRFNEISLLSSINQSAIGDVL